MAVRRDRAEQSPLRTMDRIFHHDGLVSAGTEGDDGDRNFHEIRKKAQIGHGCLGQILELATVLRRALPARQGLEDWMATGEVVGAAGEVIDPFAIQFVGHADLNLIEFIQHIQLGDGEAIEAVHLNGVATDHPVESSRASPAPAGGGSEFTAALRQLIVEAPAQFGRERPLTDAGGVGLGHTDDPVDQGGSHSGTDAGTSETGFEEVTWDKCRDQGPGGFPGHLRRGCSCVHGRPGGWRGCSRPRGRQPAAVVEVLLITASGSRGSTP